jgi:hypothetical protein
MCRTAFMDTATEPAQICAGVFRHSGTVACEEGEATHLLCGGIDFLGERRKSAKENMRCTFMKICWISINIGSKTSTSAYRTVTIPRTSHGLTTNHLLLETIRRQREELNLRRSNGRIGDNVHRNLERELDLKESLLA